MCGVVGWRGREEWTRRGGGWGWVEVKGRGVEGEGGVEDGVGGWGVGGGRGLGE